jgi:hypothetical protein
MPRTKDLKMMPRTNRFRMRRVARRRREPSEINDTFKEIRKSIEVLLFWSSFLDANEVTDYLCFEKCPREKLDRIKHCVQRLGLDEEQFLRLLEESRQKHKDDDENVKIASLLIHRISKAWFD